MIEITYRRMRDGLETTRIFDDVDKAHQFMATLIVNLLNFSVEQKVI